MGVHAFEVVEYSVVVWTAKFCLETSSYRIGLRWFGMEVVNNY